MQSNANATTVSDEAEGNTVQEAAGENGMGCQQPEPLSRLENPQTVSSSSSDVHIGDRQDDDEANEIEKDMDEIGYYGNGK